MAPDSRAAAFLLISVLVSLVTFPIARARDDSIESSPLNITAQSTFGAGPGCKGQNGILLQFHYAGAQPLRGYLVRLVLTGSSTKQILQEQTVKEIRKSNEPMIANGTEWTRNVCTFGKKLSGDGAAVTAKVDVLKFADGSIWGPLELRESHQLIGRLDGIDFMEKETQLERFVTPILPEQGPLPIENVKSELLGPLRVESGLWRDEHGQDMLAVEITNESKKPIRGYLLTTSFFDPNSGALIRRFSTKELETHGDPDRYLAPGTAWIADPRKYSYLPNGTLASYNITLDLVAFADGSAFGPKKSQESDEMLGIIEGIDDAKRMSEASAKNER